MTSITTTLTWLEAQAVLRAVRYCGEEAIARDQWGTQNARALYRAHDKFERLIEASMTFTQGEGR